MQTSLETQVGSPLRLKIYKKVYPEILNLVVEVESWSESTETGRFLEKVF